MSKLSVVIATKNEERNIENCLESVKWADEIVIVDDFSQDNTVEICKKYTDKIFLNDSKGSFHKNKNLGIEKATGEWILSLDADEIVPNELAEEIKIAIQTQKLGYYLNRKNYFLNKWIRGCGWYPDYIIRLFKKGTTNWPLNIHQIPKIEQKSKVGYLKSHLIHYSYQSLNQYFEKFNRFTSQLAQEEYDKGRKISKKNFLLYFFIKPIFYFFKKYILQGGFRDASRGLFISLSSALVVFVTYAKLWEIQKHEKV
ncbi:MAG: glycosyltransferase family 2 protein [Elusimicrobiota bacterium]|nr:glycosyltransferase family 2 protein [Elusimicrobiota bacterium]